MADTKEGKKGKKAKKTVLSLDQFNAMPAGGHGPTGSSGGNQLDALDWANELEENLPTEPLSSGRGGRGALPSAPRSMMNQEIDLSTIPQNPPYLLALENAPFEATSDMISRFFHPLILKDVSLQMEYGRRKAPQVELETRDDLIKAIKEKNDTMLGTRRVYLKNPAEMYGDDRSGRDRGGYGGNRNSNQGLGLDPNRRGSGPDLTLTNWRQQARAPSPPPPQRQMERRSSQDYQRHGGPPPRDTDDARYPGSQRDGGGSNNNDYRRDNRPPPRDDVRIERGPIPPAPSSFTPMLGSSGPGGSGGYGHDRSRGGGGGGDIVIERAPIVVPPPGHLLPYNEHGGPRFEMDRSNSREDVISRSSQHSTTSYGEGRGTSGSRAPAGGPANSGSRDTPYGDMPPAGYDARRAPPPRGPANYDRPPHGRDSREGSGGFRRNDSYGQMDSDDRGPVIRRAPYIQQPTREPYSRQESRESSYSQPPPPIVLPVSERVPQPPAERPKLDLKPRTAPIGESSTGTATTAGTSSSIFGGAKPVDTAARERAIEQKEMEKRQKGKEMEEAAKKAKLEAEANATAASLANASIHPKQILSHKTSLPPTAGGPSTQQQRPVASVHPFRQDSSSSTTSYDKSQRDDHQQHKGAPLVATRQFQPLLQAGPAVPQLYDSNLERKNRILRQTSSNASESSDRGAHNDDVDVDVDEGSGSNSDLTPTNPDQEHKRLLDHTKRGDADDNTMEGHDTNAMMSDTSSNGGEWQHQVTKGRKHRTTTGTQLLSSQAPPPPLYSSASSSMQQGRVFVNQTRARGGGNGGQGVYRAPGMAPSNPRASTATQRGGSQPVGSFRSMAAPPPQQQQQRRYNNSSEGSGGIQTATGQGKVGYSNNSYNDNNRNMEPPQSKVAATTGSVLSSSADEKVLSSSTDVVPTVSAADSVTTVAQD